MRKGLTGDTTLSETGMVYGSISTSLAAYSTKLVTTALEWSYEAKDVDVKAETLKNAAELLILRRDTLRLIDGAGPSVEVAQSEDAADEARRDETEERSSAESEHSSDPHDEQARVSNAVGNSALSAKPGKCTF